MGRLGRGLGYVMLNANARMQTDVCFAALFILVLMTVLLWAAVDALLRRLIARAPENDIPVIFRYRCVGCLCVTRITTS